MSRGLLLAWTPLRSRGGVAVLPSGGAMGVRGQSRSMIYRMPEKLFQKQVRTTHLIQRLSGHIENGVIEKPDWWDDVLSNPMISIPRKRLSKSPITTPDDELLAIISKREPHLDDAPHALAPGLSRYYKHPKQVFLEGWKRYMAEGLDRETAYTKVLLDQHHERLLQQIEAKEQVRQAGVFGAPAPDIGEQLEALDRDMKQAVQPGIVQLNQKRFDRLQLLANTKIEKMDQKIDPEYLRAAVDLEAAVSRIDGDNLVRSLRSTTEETLDEIEAASSLLDPFVHGADAPDPSRDDLARVKLEKQKRLDAARSDPNHLSIEADNVEKIISDSRPLTHHDVRQLIPDALWLDFKQAHPQLERAFDPMLWNADPAFAEAYYERAVPTVEGQLSHPSAAPLRAKQTAHLFDLAATAPHVGFDPFGNALEPDIPENARDISNIADLLRMYKPFQTDPGNRFVPQPEDLVSYSSPAEVAPAPLAGEDQLQEFPFLNDEDYDDTLYPSDPDADPRHLLEPDIAGSLAHGAPITTKDLELETELAKSHLLARLDSLRSFLIESDRLNTEAHAKMQRIKPHDPEHPRAK